MKRAFPVSRQESGWRSKRPEGPLQGEVGGVLPLREDGGLWRGGAGRVLPLREDGVSGEASARLEWGRHTVLGKTATSKLVSWYRNVNL